jgi:hypothetical protein
MTLSQAKEDAWAILHTALPHSFIYRDFPGGSRQTLTAIQLQNKIANALLAAYRVRFGAGATASFEKKEKAPLILSGDVASLN